MSHKQCCFSTGAIIIVLISFPLLTIGIYERVLYGDFGMGRCNTTNVNLRPEQGGEHAGQIITLNVNVILEGNEFNYEFESVCDCFENHIVCITCENMQNLYPISNSTRYDCWWYPNAQKLLVNEIETPGLNYLASGGTFVIIGLLFIAYGCLEIRKEVIEHA